MHIIRAAEVRAQSDVTESLCDHIPTPFNALHLSIVSLSALTLFVIYTVIPVLRHFIFISDSLFVLRRFLCLYRFLPLLLLSLFPPRLNFGSSLSEPMAEGQKD